MSRPTLNEMLAMPSVPFEIREEVRQLRKRNSHLETELGAAERTKRNQHLEVERLKKQLKTISEAKHEPGCEYDYAPRWECPSCPSPQTIAQSAMGGRKK